MKILIVDDNYFNVFLLQSILMENKIKIVTANDGEKAIEALKKTDFNLIFMDIEMPVMNGIETTNYIRTKLSEPKNKTPIVAITAHNIEYELINNADFNYVMLKTYEPEKIIKVVNKYASK